MLSWRCVSRIHFIPCNTTPFNIAGRVCGEDDHVLSKGFLDTSYEAADVTFAAAAKPILILNLQHTAGLTSAMRPVSSYNVPVLCSPGLSSHSSVPAMETLTSCKKLLRMHTPI